MEGVPPMISSPAVPGVGSARKAAMTAAAMPHETASMPFRAMDAIPAFPSSYTRMYIHISIQHRERDAVDSVPYGRCPMQAKALTGSAPDRRCPLQATALTGGVPCWQRPLRCTVHLSLCMIRRAGRCDTAPYGHHLPGGHGPGIVPSALPLGGSHAAAATSVWCMVHPAWCSVHGAP